MGVKVKQVEGKRDLKEFIRLPWSIYRDDPYWVPPLISETKKNFDKNRNPYFDHSEAAFFIVEKNGKPVGRIIAHIDNLYISFQQEKVGFFGFFECTNDYDCAKALFDAASEWLSKRGMPLIRGPFNFSTNSEVGLLVDGFEDSPVVMMTYNPRYYVDLVERYGFVKAKDIYAYIIDTPEIPERLENIMSKLANRAEFKIRRIDMKKLKSEIKLVKEIYNSAWEKNWGFVPMTEREFDEMAKNLKLIVDPDLALLAEYKGKPIAFLLAVPDINFALKHIRSGRLFPFGIFKLLYWSKRITKIRVLTLGVIREFRKKGVELALYYEIFKAGIKNGYREAELSWILEDNFLMRKGIEDFGGRIYKTYRFYEKKL